MIEGTSELVRSVQKGSEDRGEVEACVWGKDDSCRVILYRSQIQRLLDTSQNIDDSVIFASLKSLEVHQPDVYAVDPLVLSENVQLWPDKTAWAKMVEKMLTKDDFKVNINYT